MKHLHRSLFALLFLLLGAVSVVAAQAASTCPDIVKAALQATSGACAGIGRNQACYGNFTLQTQFQSNSAPAKFDAIGDLADVTNIKSLQLSSMSLTDSSWGVALMKIQANLPDALPGQNVSFVLFGNVEIGNAVDPLVTLPLTARSGANVRSHPSTQGTVLVTLKPAASVVANGRLADSSWLRIQLPDGSGDGWVSASLLQGGSVSSLAVVDPSASTPVFGPMQAFYFKSGLGDTPCTEVPPNGILLQSPMNQKVTLMVDGAQLTLGSTVFVQAQPGGFMTISVIEGSVAVTVNGVAQTVPAGESTRIPLDVNGVASGAPEAPQPYDATALAALPVTLLPIPITIASLATPEATAAATAAPEAAAVEATAIVTTDALPLSGSWSETQTTSGCNGSIQVTVTAPVKVENNGAVLDFGGGYFFDRTAPGVYSARALPVGFTKTGSNHMDGTATLYILSSTQMRGVGTDSVTSQNNCQYSISDQLTYVGP